MTAEETEEKGSELIIKLNEKFDKCKWEKVDGSVPKAFSTRFNSGKILISMNTIMAFSNDAGCVLEYKPKKYNEAGVLAIMWGKVADKIQAPIDAQILSIIEELDKL